MVNFLVSKAKSKQIEVEDILKLVKKIQPRSINDDLNELKLQISTNYDEEVSILFNKWIDIVSIFFEKSYNGLIEIALQNKNFAPFAISVLEETKTSEGLKSLIEIIRNSKLKDNDGYKSILDSIAAINMMISFDDDIFIAPEDSESAKSLIHDFLKFNKENTFNEGDVVVAYCALRKIGDLETIKLIKNMPALMESQNMGIDSTVMKQIEKKWGKTGISDTQIRFTIKMQI